jgi:hypothetical protein
VYCTVANKVIEFRIPLKVFRFLSPLFFKLFSRICHDNVQEYQKDVELYGRNP